MNNDLDNLLTNLRVATLFLDHNLEIRRFTPEVTRFIRIIDQNIGRPFDHLTHDLMGIDLEQVVKQANTGHARVEREVRDRAGNTYLMRVFPYRIGHEIFSGVLLTFININASKRTQLQLRRSEESYRLAQKAAGLGAWSWDIVSAL
ncbi:MAG: hypothetical protein G8D58_13990 [gamma proteobacterium symbiont of Phacoides pectinatus]